MQDAPYDSIPTHSQKFDLNSDLSTQTRFLASPLFKKIEKNFKYVNHIVLCSRPMSIMMNIAKRKKKR